MPSGWDNNCEIELDEGELKSKPEVLHAESNAISKLARSNESGENSTLFLTHSPCLECSKLIKANELGIPVLTEEEFLNLIK